MRRRKLVIVGVSISTVTSGTNIGFYLRLLKLHIRVDFNADI